MKLSFVPIALFFMTATAQARLGETEQEMVDRFGKPMQRGEHTVIAQGKSWVLGPTVHFRQEDWQISADLVDGRCVRIAYSKRGDWTEEQVQLVLGSNSQGIKWTETSKPNTKKIERSWRRNDGALAGWSTLGSIRMVVPAYDRAKQVVEAKAKAEVSRKPKI